MDESEGSFSIQTIKNYLNACEMLNRKELGLDHLMSSAEAAIEYLDRQSFLSFCLNYLIMQQSFFLHE
jgi:hypothetical protein